MLKEFLDNPQSILDVNMQEVVSGVEICYLDTMQKDLTYPIHLNTHLDENKAEVFMCTQGSIMVERKKGSPVSVTANEILLLGHVDYLHSALIACPVQGIFIYIDKIKFKENLREINHLFKHPSLTCDEMCKIPPDRRSCYILKESVWTQALFTSLASMDFSQILEGSMGNYIALKLMELVYLIHHDNNVLDSKTSENYSDGYLIQTITQIKQYMESHLDEKHTINSLASMFHVAPTTLKIAFRSVYGKPIHSWLQSQRMTVAAHLLHSSNISILEVAQHVGFEGVSQFNVIFKRYYGTTPGQFRKMSNTVK